MLVSRQIVWLVRTCAHTLAIEDSVGQYYLLLPFIFIPYRLLHSILDYLLLSQARRHPFLDMLLFLLNVCGQLIKLILLLTLYRITPVLGQFDAWIIRLTSFLNAIFRVRYGRCGTWFESGMTTFLLLLVQQRLARKVWWVAQRTGWAVRWKIHVVDAATLVLLEHLGRYHEASSLVDLVWQQLSAALAVTLPSWG